MTSSLFDCLQVSVEDSGTSGPRNMAMDEALLMGCRPGDFPVLRIYGWDQPTISLGYFEPVAPWLSSEMPVVRRWTGGGQVTHGSPQELTYTLVVPSDHAFYRVRSVDSYQAIHTRLVAALAEVGIRAALHEQQAASPGGPCFRKAVVGDVIDPVTKAKLAGAGQRRHRRGLIHQGSVKLASEVPRELSGALIKALAGTTTALAVPLDDSQLELLIAEKYAHPEWTQRR